VGEPACRDGVVDLAAGHGQAERPVAGGGTLGRDQDVGADAPVVAAEPAAGAAEAGHHLVGHQQHAMGTADLGHGRPVVVRRHGRAERGPGHRLGHERRHRLGPGLADGRVQGVGVAPAAAGRVGVAERAAVLVGGQGVAGMGEPGQVGPAQGRAPRDVERAAGVAVVGVFPADHLPAVLTACQVVGAGHLQRGLDRLAAAGDRVDTRVVDRHDLGELGGVVLQHLGGEHGSVGVGDPGRLRPDRLHHPLVAVAEADHDGPAGAVEPAAPSGVPQLRALAAVDPGRVGQAGAGEDMARPGRSLALPHGRQPMPQACRLATRCRLAVA
jgi:hypothetical protein